MRALTAEVLRDPALEAACAERLEAPLKALKLQRLRSAQESGDLPAELDLDLAIDLLWGPMTSRWLQRAGPLTHAYADQAVERALYGLRAPVDR